MVKHFSTINRYITPCSRTGSRCMKSNSCVVFVQCISVIATSLLASDWSDITVLQLPTWNNPIAIVNNYTIDTTFFRRKINVLYNRQYLWLLLLACLSLAIMINVETLSFVLLHFGDWLLYKVCLSHPVLHVPNRSKV